MTRALSILVVDDDIDNASSLGELFEMEGHDVRVVHSGEEAIRAYVAQTFDLAFMDVMMPGKNGVDSFLEIRQMKPEARVFMMTGYSVEELLQQAVRGGALGVLAKPFDSNEVLRLTESVGPGGLVITAPETVSAGAGEAIHHAVVNSGRRCRIVRNAMTAAASIDRDEVLVVDSQLPLIDEVSVYSAVRKMGHEAPTILVTPKPKEISVFTPSLRDVGITGILNKPFDPMELLVRLPLLAA